MPRNIVSLLVTLLACDTKTTVNCATMFTYPRWNSLGTQLGTVSRIIYSSSIHLDVTSFSYYWLPFYSINYRFDWLSSILIYDTRETSVSISNLEYYEKTWPSYRITCISWFPVRLLIYFLARRLYTSRDTKYKNKIRATSRRKNAPWKKIDELKVHL